MFNAKILLIDSNEAFLESHLKSLRDIYDHVNGAKNLEAAENFLRDDDYDVVVYDAAIDGNNGFDTLARIHKYSSNISIIVYSKSPEASNVISILKNGAFDYLILPFDINSLINSIKKGIENKKSFLEIVNLNKKLIDNQSALEQDKEDLKRKNTKLESLTSITKAMTGTLDLDDILHEIIFGIYNAFLFDRIFVSLIDAKRGVEEAKVAMGLSDNIYDETIKELVWEIGDIMGNPWMERLIKEKSVVKVLDPLEDELYKNCKIVRFHPSTFVKVPLIAEGNVVGTLTFDNLMSGKDISDDEIKTVRVFADHAGIAIEKARLYKNLKVAHETLKEMQDKIIQAQRLMAISEVAAGVNHEINNPLCSISLNVEILQRNLAGSDDKIKEKIDMIQKDIERIRDITSKLTKITQVTTKEYDKDTKMVDIDRSVDLSESDRGDKCFR
jgi:DNA-binding response OmpR family regulator